MERSEFDYLELEVGDLKLTVGKKGFSWHVEEKPTASQHAIPNQVSSQIAAKPEAIAPEPETHKKPSHLPKRVVSTPIQDGLVPIKATMVGIFYAQSEPGASPFVKNGSIVDENTTVGLIEVMKLFSSIRAGVRGVIEEILVENAQFVEHGQPLFLVKPEQRKEASKKT